jgi:hypothetical protein
MRPRRALGPTHLACPPRMAYSVNTITAFAVCIRFSA